MMNFARACWKILSRFIIWCLKLILKPFHKELTEEQQVAFLQFCKFALVGVSNTLVSTAINYGMLFIGGKANWFSSYVVDTQKTLQAVVANCVAFFLSVLWSYFWNNKFVFKEDQNAEKRVWWKTLLRTYVAYAFTGLGISNLVSWLCVKQLGISPYFAVLINLVVAVPINYVMNKFWAYAQKDNKQE